MSQLQARRRQRGGARTRAGVIGMLAVVGLAGCDSLLEADLPGTLPAENLRDPDNAPMLANSVQAQFECYFGHYVGATAPWVDEAIAGSQRAGRHFYMTRQVQPYENRGLGECESGGEDWTFMGTGYNTLGLGRDVSQWFEEWTDAEVANRMDYLALTRAYTAYTTMLFGESFCAGAVLEPDAELSTPREVMAAAEQWWTDALDAATQAGNEQIRNLALVGRARTRLWQGDLQGAAADAEQVAPGFRYDATYALHPQRENKVSTEFGRDKHYTVDPANRDLTVDGVPDPRVDIVDRDRIGIDGRTPIFTPSKYVEDDAPIRMASWEEAQLIVAEARLGQEAVDRINALRAMHGLPSYTPPSLSDDVILDQVLEERRRELFMEGQRMNDMLRHFDRASIRNAWPEGITPDGDPYFPSYCHWFPEREIEANPNVGPEDIPRSMTPDVMYR